MPELARPTVWLTNWSSSRSNGYTGPEHGQRFTIMASPRHWEHGDGQVQVFVPSMTLRDAYVDGRMAIEMYLEKFQEDVWRESREGLTLRPRKLLARRGRTPRSDWIDDRGFSPVKDGATLFCACSRSAAAGGECHRVPTAWALLAHGWRVFLDGVEIGLATSNLTP